MAVIDVNEVLPRGYSHMLGGSPTATMLFVVTVDGETPQAQVLSALGYALSTPHPEFSFLECNGIELTETDKFHVEASLSFALPDPSQPEPGSVPWSLPDTWTFSTGHAQQACTTHFPTANDNVLTAPLVNKANDAYEGLVRIEPELKAVINGFRQKFPAGLATELTGAINSFPYAGGALHTWQCVGISGTPERTTIGTQLVEYWAITAELTYRQSTHNLLLPNAGLNYLENGMASKKRRCWVVDESGEKVPSAGPMALNDDGDMKQIGAGPYPPDILTFRIYPEYDFAQFFGDPPNTVSLDF